MSPKSIYRGMVRQFEESVIAHHVAGNEITAANLEESRTKLLKELNKVIEGQRAYAIQEGYSKAVTAAIKELREENARLRNLAKDSEMDAKQDSVNSITLHPNRAIAHDATVSRS